MKMSHHPSVGEITTPDTIDIPNVPVDTRAIGEYSLASNAEQNSIDHHTRIIDTAYAQNKSLAESNIKRLNNGITHLTPQVQKISDHLEKTDAYKQNTTKSNEKPSHLDHMARAFCFIVAAAFSLMATFTLVNYYYQNPHNDTSLSDASSLELGFVLFSLLIPAILSLPVKFLASKIQTDRNRQLYYLSLGLVPIVAGIYWIYCYTLLAVAPTLQGTGELIDSMVSFDESDESIASGLSNTTLAIHMILAQVAVEICVASIIIIYGSSIFKKYTHVSYDINPEHKILENRHQEKLDEIGKLRYDRDQNQSFLDFIIQAKQSYLAQARSEFSHIRAKIEQVELVKVEQQKALNLLDNQSREQEKFDEQERLQQEQALIEFQKISHERLQAQQDRKKQEQLDKQHVMDYASGLIEKIKGVPQLNLPKIDDTNDSEQPSGADVAPISQRGTASFSIKIATFFLTVFLLALAPTLQAKTRVIAVSNSVDKTTAADVMKASLKILTEDLTKGDRLVAIDATKLKVISSIELSSELKKDSPKRRIHKASAEIVKLKQYLSKAIKNEDKKGQIFLPQLFNSFGLNFPYSKEDVSFLIIGNPLYHDDSNQFSLGYSMRGGYVPSDGHIKTERKKSPFSVHDKYLSQIDVHFVNTFSEWVDLDKHQMSIHRFWDLHITERGGTLATFTEDFDSGLNRFLSGSKREANFIYDELDSKVLMKRIMPAQVKRETEEWMFNEYTLPPATERENGKIKIGITWENCSKCDLDLHARGSRNYKPLYFANHTSNEGRFHKDYRQAPNQQAKNGYEFVEFTRDITFSEAEIRVNFYSGFVLGGVKGTVRVWLDGQVFVHPFEIKAMRGNKGKQSLDHWVDINLLEILHS